MTAAPLLYGAHNEPISIGGSAPVREEHLPSGFMWKREIPREWQGRLSKLFEESIRLSWMRLGWWAADPVYPKDGGIKWDPVQRWVVFQMIPAEKLSPMVIAILEGPPPGKDNRQPLSRLQWEWWRHHRAYAMPYWIIQGDKGGHKRRFNQEEQKILRALGRRDTPPEAGSLPYADFDDRVVEKLTKLDHYKVWARSQAYDERSLDAEEAESRKAMRAWLTDWLYDQVDAAVDDILSPTRPLVNETDPNVKPLDWDRVKHDFIHTDL